MRTIYMSAHSDDAILSCGGAIFDQCSEGDKVEVWTFFCGVPKGLPIEGFVTRIKEDTEAVHMVGARPEHFGFLDAIYRRNKEDQKIYASVFSPIHPLDMMIIDSISTMIERRTDEEDILMCPLAVGAHVDHLILRLACEKLGRPIVYYTDFPYIDYVPEKLDAAIVGLNKHFQYVSPKGLEVWQDASCVYASQQLYPTQTILRTKINEYWSPSKGIYLWKKEA
jgi:hypothetical protein